MKLKTGDLSATGTANSRLHYDVVLADGHESKSSRHELPCYLTCQVLRKRELPHTSGIANGMLVMLECSQDNPFFLNR